MGCICSKGSSSNQYVSDGQKEAELNASHLVVPPKREEAVLDFIVDGGSSRATSKVAPANSGSVGGSIHHVAPQSYSGSLNGSTRHPSRAVSHVNSGSLTRTSDEGSGKMVLVEWPVKGLNHQGRATVYLAADEGQKPVTRIISIPNAVKGEQIIAGWPTWLSSVAAEAIQGWVPRRIDSFEKIDRIGQGTYSSVYKALDLENGKVVAMKKVRFVNMDPESVRFMAREILILRKLDHPNVIKLEGLVTSKMSGSLYLVFEYMEHDLAGLAAAHGTKFTESQIKCYMQQLLSGLEHCHSRGVLHRDIKGANLLLNNDGVLKIGDFGLGTFFRPEQKQPLTSRVVTLWYRAPELLLGSTDYGVAIDLWSVGCIVAEMFAGKPIMPGRTEVEQLHTIFKLCGSPSENFWKKSKDASGFKRQQPYQRQIVETFKDFPPSALSLVDVLLSMEPEKRGTASAALTSQFFTANPLPCDPSSLPKYPPSKEFNVKFGDEGARRRKAEAVKGRMAESVRGDQRESRPVHTPEFDADRDYSLKGKVNSKGTIACYNQRQHAALTVDTRKGMNHCSSVAHPSASGSSWTRKMRKDGIQKTSEQIYGSPRNVPDVNVQKDDWISGKEPSTKQNRIYYSGPLMPHGGNIEGMLKEHERQIQQAVRKARARNKNDNGGQGHAESLHYHGRNL